MFDLTTLAILAALFISAVAGEAAFYSDTLHLHIGVPASLEKTGFDEEFAEQTFTSEAARIIRGHSIIPAPSMRVQSQPTIASAIAQPLRLGPVVQSLQNHFGVEALSVTAAILESEVKPGEKPVAGKRPPLEMALIVSEPEQHDPAQVRLTQEDGDPVALVQQAAQWTMERVAPYRVALAHFLTGVQGDPGGFAAARETALRNLDMPWQAQRASERAMMYNILANIALVEGKPTDAIEAYDLADQVSDVMPAVRAEMGLNHALVAVVLKRPAEAAEVLKQAERASTDLDLPGFAANLRLVEGLVAWANGDLTTAEETFRDIATREPLNEAGHHYLGKLLAARGDKDGATAQTNFATAVHLTEPPTQGLVARLFWIDPVEGSLTKRF